MIELSLLDIHPDRTQLILTDLSGQRYCLPITDSLRDSLRQEHVTLQAVKKTLGGQLPSPQVIQSLIRMGTTTAEIAEQFDVEEKQVARFQAPILDERRYAASVAQSCRIGTDADAPTMKELVIDRLAARGIDSETITWDAIRRNHEPWEIIVTFVQAAQRKEAHWQLLLNDRSVKALDQEAVWLTETSLPTHSDPFGVSSLSDWEIEQRHNQHSSSHVSSTDQSKTPSPYYSQPAVGTESLIDELNASRGIRQEVDMDEFLDDEDDDTPQGALHHSAQGEVISLRPVAPDHFSSQDADSDASSHNAQTHDQMETNPHSTSATCEQETENNSTTDLSSAHDETSSYPTTGILPGLDDIDKTQDAHSQVASESSSERNISSAHHEDSSTHPESERPARSSRSHRTRRSVPTWDEIVFGARTH